MIEQLQSEGTIRLSFKPLGSFKEYLADLWSSWWFYVVIIVAVSELFFVISDVQNGPFLLLRTVFGLGVLGIIPGFLTVLAVFPGGGVNTLEKIALCVFRGVLISITVGVVLGIGLLFRATNRFLLLSAYVVLLDVLRGYRHYRCVK